jgi:phosphoribosyl 1,2-cyclic phosphodiesterase
MRFASLGSGSQGNALVVECGSTRVMLDCGFGTRELGVRLGRLGLQASDLSALIVTHEHSDHIAGAYKFARHAGIPVYLTYGTLNGFPGDRGERPELAPIDSHTNFNIGEVGICPYPVPHDAREPVQFVLTDGDRRLGVLTDTGMSTPHIEATLSGCDALVLECNHDRDMLEAGDYPLHLKRRIAGRFGHLDNVQSAALLSALDRSRLKHVVAAHLSQHNNRPELARNALAVAMGCAEHWIRVATQEEGFPWLEV